MEVTVEKLVYGGFGLAHHERRVLLIPFAAPGDQLLVEPIQEKKGLTVVRIEKIIEASPQRRVPPCPYYQMCGGCQLQHLTYEAQCEAKLGFIRESLSRIGGIDWPHDIPLLYGPEFNYRLRAQLKIKVANGKTQIGYFKAESHEVCEVESCLLLSPRLNQVLTCLRPMPSSQLKEAQTIDLVQGDGEKVGSYPIVGLPESDNVSLSVGSFTYTLNAQVFFQVNRFLLQAMLNMVIGEEKGRVALDLYCGAGFFTIPLARQFEQTMGVESDSRTVKLALENARRNNVTRVHFIAAPVEKWLAHQEQLQDKLDFVLVDPPRPGLTRKVIGQLTRLRPAHITYVSCNPTTLARDLKHLQRRGYRLIYLGAIDLFPQTFHIETVAKLQPY